MPLAVAQVLHELVVTNSLSFLPAEQRRPAVAGTGSQAALHLDVEGHDLRTGMSRLLVCRPIAEPVPAKAHPVRTLTVELQALQFLPAVGSAASDTLQSGF